MAHDKPLYVLAHICNKWVSEMQAPLAARREPAGGLEWSAKYAMCFWT